MGKTSTNPFLQRQDLAPKNAHGKRSEKRIAQTLGARLTPASGATAGAKGDMKHVGDGFKVLMEAKSTVAQTLSVELAWLQKITKEALEKGMTPALTLSFVRPDGNALPHGEWVAVPLWAWQELLERQG